MQGYTFFLFLRQNIDCGYSLEPPRQKKYQNFSVENFQFIKLKKSLFIAWACFRNENKFKVYLVKVKFVSYQEKLELLAKITWLGNIVTSERHLILVCCPPMNNQTDTE